MENTFSYITNAHPSVIENLYHNYKKDPSSVDAEYKKFFEGFDYAVGYEPKSASGSKSSSVNFSNDEFKAYHLIQKYRNFGHLVANTNPLKKRKDRGINLSIESVGLSEADLSKKFQMSSELGIKDASLAEIVDYLNKCYTGNIGFEYNQVREEKEIEWIRTKIEQNPNFVKYSLEKETEILKGLNKAVVFEEFLGKKYIGEKRFSLEGSESTIPGIQSIINKSADHGVKEVVIGMAHRGRLNVLVNIMGKSYEEVFTEFDGTNSDSEIGDNDVKYHKGFSSMMQTNAGEIYLDLLANPSHLEAVDPLVIGFARAKGDMFYGKDYSKVLPIMIHGDAAVSGQGILLETVQMSKLKGYETKGTLHFVINNQIGFTTDFDDSRSSDYSTAVAYLVNAPVIHVNGDDVEAVVYACEMAVEYRQIFGKDIFVDMVSYRKHGHNESDDPKYTQPAMYKLIDKKRNSRDIYAEVLTNRGEVQADLVKKLDKEFYDELQDRLNRVKEESKDYKFRPEEKAWKKMMKARSHDFEKSPVTAISNSQFDLIANKLFELPADFSPLKKIEKQMADWKDKMIQKKTLDWQAAELLAYGSILVDKKNIRFTGEDVKRGTFSHRHACLFDQNTNQEFNRLSNLSSDQGFFEIHNSLLSEYGVLGYEYGYSIASPDNLVIWEAQFGDFVNGAQIILDQFLVSSETKWKVNSGMVLLLPHGYEGQGPEHSSARMERLLQMCAEFNIQVMNITSPANYFHAIRRQFERNFRIPLIIMTPKSLLRYPKCISPVEDVLNGGFKEIIDDETAKPKSIKRVLYCSGKIYYDLLAYKEENKRDDVALVRMEQLYPIAIDQLEATFEKYVEAEKYWVQEEPANMGAWTYLLDRQYRMKGQVLFKLIARKTSSSPATGLKKQHVLEHQDIINRAFN
jgi:2-oxoglutarate dehydrogenase E1 component